MPAPPPNRRDGRRPGPERSPARHCEARYAPSATPAACPSAASKSPATCRWPRPMAAGRGRAPPDRASRQSADRAARRSDIRPAAPAWRSSNSSSGLNWSTASTPAPRLEGLVDGDEVAGRDGDCVFWTGSGATLPDRRSSAEGAIPAGPARWRAAPAANASAAVPPRNCLVGRRIARHIGLDRLHRNFLRAAGQQEDPPDQQQDDDNQENQASRHGYSAWIGWVRERLLPDLAPLCIAPAKGVTRQKCKS